MIFKKKNIILIFFLFFQIHFTLAQANAGKINANKAIELKTIPHATPIKEAIKQTNLIISSINIETKNQKLKSSLEFRLYKYRNKKFSQHLQEVIQNKIISFLIAEKIFNPKWKDPIFKIEKNNLSISYKISEPYHYIFLLKGNKLFKSHQLLSKRIYNLLFNNNQPLRKILFHIRESYLKRGYSSIQVKNKLKIEEAAFKKKFYISINEGNITKIRGIKVSGNFSKSKTYYIDFIKDHSGPLIHNRLFYKKDIEMGFQNLHNSMRNEGYLKAKVHPQIVKVGTNGIIIDIVLNEGPLTVVEKINFKGNQYFSNKELMDWMSLKLGKALNINQLEQDIQNIIAKYEMSGFIDVTLRNKDKLVTYNSNQETAQLNFDIVENARASIAGIFVKGNHRTKESFILKNLPLKKGDILTPENINLSFKQLRSLGIFSTINILVQENNKDPSNKNVIIQVEEDKSRTVRVAVGVNTERTLTTRGLIEFSNRNIGGTGRQLFSQAKLQSNISRYVGLDSKAPQYLERQISTIYTEPFLFGSDLNGQIQFSDSYEIFSHYRTKQTDFTNIVNATQVNLILQTKLNLNTQLRWTVLGWEGRKEFEKNDLCKKSNITNSPSFNCADSLLRIANTDLSLSIDKRNNIISTSQGFLSQASIEYSGPFYIIQSSENISFIKSELKHFDFQPLSNEWVLVNSTQLGWIANINPRKNSGIPVSRSFILGGTNSLRGFDGLIDGDRVPEKKELPIQSANELIVTRYSFYALLKTELRFPITKNLNGAVFYDVGLVTIAEKDFEQPYRQSAGFGIMYKTPLGFLSGYMAFKLNPKEGELIFLPHLSFGNF